jgi:hypothetical protein
MLDDELRELLRELCAASGAVAAAVGPAEPPPTPRGPLAVRVELDGGAVLVAWFGAADGDDAAAADASAARRAALERTARAIRASTRRWDVEVAAIPAVTSEGSPAAARQARLRIQAFLDALVGSLGMTAAVVTRKVSIVASAGQLGELERERVPFTVRRVHVEIDRRRGRSSHAEIVGDDVYAVSFWYDACLVCFFAAPFSPDFVRHRARLVTRELTPLLAMLDVDPDLDPVQTAPRPPAAD